MHPHRSVAFIALLFVTRVEAQGATPVLLRQLYGDLAIEVRSAGAGAMYVGAADSSRSVALILRAEDVRRWADSATRVLTAKLRAGELSGRWQAAVEEPGVRSGSMMISRTIDGRDTVIAFFLADDSLMSVRRVVDRDEAEALVGALKRAATRMLPPPKRPAKPPRRPAGLEETVALVRSPRTSPPRP